MEKSLQEKHAEFQKFYGQLEKSNTANLVKIADLEAKLSELEFENQNQSARLNEISKKEQAENDAKIAELNEIIARLQRNPIPPHDRPNLGNKPIDPLTF